MKNINGELCELNSRAIRVFEKLVKTVEDYLDKTHPGLLTRLDWYFYQKHRESFIKHLLSKPEETLMEIANYYGVDSFEEADIAKYIVYVVLKNFFMNNSVYFEEAFNCIKQCEWIRLKKIVKKYIESLVFKHQGY